ncbi:MAG TPA: DUF167 domain-containing protein [Trichocoleus sp.]
MSFLQVQVKPNAKQQKIQKTEVGWVVHLKAAPVDGKANKELIEVLSRELGIAKSQIQIKTGGKTRHKLVEILGEP